MSKTSRIFQGRFGHVWLKTDSGAVARHSHLEHQLAFLYEGSDRKYCVAGECMVLTRDDIMMINAGLPHESNALDGSTEAQVLGLYLSPEWLCQTFPAAFPAGDAKLSPKVKQTITPYIRKLADAMAIEIRNDRFRSAGRLEFLLHELMLSIVESYLARRRASSPLWRGSRFADSRIRRALGLLRARPNKAVNMDRIATQVGLSRSRFYDLFQMCTGRSPREYLDMLCVGAAITRLSTTDTKIADVSAELGFSAQSNFTRFFLNQVGTSPSEYRRASSLDGGAVGGAEATGPLPSEILPSEPAR